MDDGRAFAKFFQLARNAVVKAGADAHNEVAFQKSLVRIGCAVHAHHAKG